jgi:hypothetical protein
MDSSVERVRIPSLVFAGLIAALLLTGVFAPPARAQPATGEDPWATAACKDPSSDMFFFPEGSFGLKLPKLDLDRALRHWYSGHLRAMAEPSLSCEDAGEAYRFLWLRTWGRPIAVRVQARDGAATVSAIELTGAGGYKPGEVRRRLNRVLTQAEWAQILDGLQRIELWTMPAADSQRRMDGAEWILEGRKGPSYHAVARWSPTEGAYRDLCLLLLKVSGALPTGAGKRDGVY